MLSPARLAASRYRGVDNTSVTAATSDSVVNGRTSCALPWRTTRLAISHWSPPPGHHHQRHAGQQRLRHHAVPAAADHQIGVRQQFVLATQPDHRPWRHLDVGARQLRHHHPRPGGQHLPRYQRVKRQLGQPRAPITAVDGATTTTGPVPAGTGSTDDVGSKCRGPTTTASHGQSGRGTSSAGRVAMRRRSGPGSTAGKPISTRAAERWRRPSRHDRAVSARITVSRSRPRTPTPGASPLPTGGRPFDGRYSGCGHNSTHGRPSQLGRQATACRDHIGHHQVRRQVAQPRHVQHRHPGGPLVDLRPGVGVVVGLGGVKPVELDGVHPRPTCGVQPFGARQQRRSVPGGEEPTAQRNGRKRVPGIRSGNHGDPHGPTLPQRRQLGWQP